jgi:esterase/lipase superfamily enzyme
MKRLMVLAAFVVVAALPLGCSKAKPDAAAHRNTGATSPPRQETSWKVGGDSAAAAPPTELRPGPQSGQAPSTLPMTADAGSEGSRGAVKHGDLKAPPAMIGSPYEAGAPRAAKVIRPKSPQASPFSAQAVGAPSDAAASPEPSLNDPRGFPAAAADPPTARSSASSGASQPAAAVAPRTLRERLAGGLTNSAASAVDPSGFATVRVFYATNRMAINDRSASSAQASGSEADPKVSVNGGVTASGHAPSVHLSASEKLSLARNFLWPAVLAAVTALFIVLRRAGVRAGALRVCTIIGVMATLTMVVVSSFVALKEYRTATRPGRHYSGERGVLEMGTCEVTIPAKHEIGEVEAPSIWRLEFKEDPTKHVVFMGAEQLENEEFFRQLQERVGRSPRKDAFVFVHGFNVSFEDAAKRTAQIAYDLNFEGAPIFFSWPSQGSALDYTVDKENSEWAATDIREFLKEIAARQGIEQIHLIAHSMGNRALTYALRGMAAGPADKRLTRKFNEVVLTAPDIDADIFKTQIAPAVVRVANRVTLYASSHDQALALSKKINGHPRAGDSGDGLVVVKGIDTIDVSAVDTSLVGHSYYGSSDTVLTDIWDLIKCAKSPDLREYLRPRDYQGGLKYWVFEPKETAASGDDPLRR